MFQSTKKPPGSATGGSSDSLSFSQATPKQIADALLAIKSFVAALAAIDPALTVALGALLIGEARS